ncbi:Ninein [Liparis tanakae]|uniref:Ninein n=1 Tax=Liparis tanakae TaxID=230148 RepID=A0A4Z2GKL9_9TELE|nr:Ninein [Liparis tanakae]
MDELQAELQEFHSLGRVHQPCHKPLSEELESKSPGMESDPGIGVEEVQPFSMSLEAEMMLEHLKEQHLQEVEDLQNQLESKVNEFDETVGKQRAAHEDQKAAVALQYQQELHALREEMAGVQSHRRELQSRLEQAALERSSLGQKRAEERRELDNLREEEVGHLRRQLLEARTYAAALEARQTEAEGNLVKEMDELGKRHAVEIKNLREEQDEMYRAGLEEERKKRAELEKTLLDDCEREKELLRQRHEDELKARLEEAAGRFEGEREEAARRLTEQWQKERTRLDEQNTESLQLVLEEEMLRMVREHEEKEVSLREQWGGEWAQLQERQEEALLHGALQERSRLQGEFTKREAKLREEWERERLQLEEDYEGMLQERLDEERQKLEAEREEEERRAERSMAEERGRLQESHSEATKELTLKHAGERDALSSMLGKLRDDIARESSEAGRLAEENVVLRQKIAALKEEDLKGISELHLQSRRLEDEKAALSGKNAQSVSDVQNLRRRLAERLEERERREALASEEKSELAACVSALEAELTKALEDAAQLSQQLSDLREKAVQADSIETRLSRLVEERLSQDKETLGLCSQLAKAQERVKTLDETLQAVNHQSAHLKADLRVSQQEKDYLKHEAAMLQKKLQNVNNKNHVLEMALHSSGLQSKSKKLYREEMSRLVDQEQHLLRQENERLQAEVRNVKGDAAQSREKVRQLDAAVVSLKQHKRTQSSLVEALEQENASLKRELEAQKDLPEGREAGQGHTQLEDLQQENEHLRDQLAQVSTQLLESFQAQFVGHLPPSPHRLPRGQHRGEEPDNMQGPVPEQRAAHADSYRRIGGL